MIGWVGWGGGIFRAEVGDDARTVTVTAEGEPSPILSTHYTEAVADAYAGPQDGYPGYARLRALAALVDGAWEYTGPPMVSDPGIVQ